MDWAHVTKQALLSARTAIAIFGVIGQHLLAVVQLRIHKIHYTTIQRADVAAAMVGRPEPPVGAHTLTIHQHLTRIAVLRPATEQALLSAQAKEVLIYGITGQHPEPVTAIIQPIVQKHTTITVQPLVTATTTGIQVKRQVHTSTIRQPHTHHTAVARQPVIRQHLLSVQAPIQPYLHIGQPLLAVVQLLQVRQPILTTV